MEVSISEQLTIAFYKFDYANRGYYLFDESIDIEPPYNPPFLQILNITEHEDDGKVPGFFKQIGAIFKTQPETKKEEEEFIPIPLGSEIELKGFSFSFVKGQEITSSITIEFINQLSFTTSPISFEIIGTSEKIIFQIICSAKDFNILQNQIRAFYSNCILKDISVFEIGFDFNRTVGIVDFGLSNECMLPIKTTESYSFDPLTSFIGSLENLQSEDVVMLQLMFKGVTAPVGQGLNHAVSDGRGGSFFAESPEFVPLTKEKTSYPLFSSVLRVAIQGNNDIRSRELGREVVRNISYISASEHNKLIPLSNEGYKYDTHLKNVYYRQSNRLGFIANSKELSTFFHFPNKTIISNKIHPETGKTKSVKNEFVGNKYILGTNNHNDVTQMVSINDTIFGKHLLIAGASGTGKTHLVKQLIQQDINFENSTFVLDPHGDLIQDILLNIDETKKENIVFINISDSDFSFGFNIFSANSEAEKVVLASDLQSAFQTSFITSGDRINAVLQKTISTFLYSSKEASILDMKRFLIEKKFRQEFIDTLEDPILLYYWENEFPLVRRNELSPLILRIDSFMQTRLLRNIFAVRKGIDFNKLIYERKTVLIQLSVGLIGLENSKFLAKLIIAKINQVAFSRAQISIKDRYPIHLYIDEAHIYSQKNPVIEQILSGARKFSLNLISVFQHLEQVDNLTLNSFLTNTSTQVFFRQNNKDARKIASSFSYFDDEDFMELGLGEALVKIDKRSNDFNLKTLPIKIKYNKTTANLIKDFIVKNSRLKYATPDNEIEKLLQSFIPNKLNKKTVCKQKETKEVGIKQHPKDIFIKTEINEVTEKDIDFEIQKKSYLKKEDEKEDVRKHLAIQNFIKAIAIQRGFKSIIEEKVTNGYVDIGLQKDNVKIAIEVSNLNVKSYEVNNIIKCIDAGYNYIYMVSDSNIHLQNIKKLALETINKQNHKKLLFLNSKEVANHLDKISVKDKPKTKRILGYRVQTNFEEDTSYSTIKKEDEIAKMIAIRMKNI